MKRQLQQIRQKLYRLIEDFFNAKGFLGVEVPTLSSYLIPESHIEKFTTIQTNPYGPDRELSLIPSPEVFLKKLISQGWGDLYCISRCYRNSEQMGRIHNPEFTMLEFYKMGANYLDSLALFQELVSFLTENLPSRDVTVSLPITQPFEMISIEEAFLRFVGFSLMNESQNGSLDAAVRSIGLNPSPDASLEELFNLTLVARIEESLPKDHPVVLYDYPSFVSTTAALCDNPFWSQRWELYIEGIELINCYSERTSVQEMKDYCLAERKLREGSALGLPRGDRDYCDLFRDFLVSSGGAVGVDRLLMAFTGVGEIESILLFPEKDPTQI